MAADTTWPPKSPHAALLSSPSGRRKFLLSRSNKENQGSPDRGSTMSPNLQRISALGPGSDEDGDEDDEEILQLKLAAIEAKLKLKKLQQNKLKLEPNNLGSEGRNHLRPASAVSSHSTTLSQGQNIHTLDQTSLPQTSRNLVEIPLSPRKTPIPQPTQRSPGRVLLGIDKGMTGADVSLGRARSVRVSPIKKRLNSTSMRERPSSQRSTYSSARSVISDLGSGTGQVKSFSERMAEARDTERAKEMKRDVIKRTRGAGLELDEVELESYRLAAEEASKHDSPKSPTMRQQETMFSRDEIVKADRKLPQKSCTMPDMRQSPPRPTLSLQRDNIGKDLIQSRVQADSTLYEPFSSLNLSSRILPDTFLKRTLPAETFTSMRLPDLLKQVTSPTYELPDSIIDFAVFGIISSKSSPMDHKIGQAKSKGTNDWEKRWEDGSQNQQKFMVLQVTDLKWSIDLFLFGTAVPRYHRLSPGTVVAILNPNIMPPKKGKEDTGAFSLTLHSSDDVVLEIGTSRDLGFCNAVKKDGKECGAWVNTSKTEICEFHLNLQVAKAQSRRMGVNTGSNGFNGGRGLTPQNKHNSVVHGSINEGGGEGRGLLPRKGPRYDRFTGNHFYIASSAGTNTCSGGAPIYRPEQSTAHMLDQDDEDPFIAEGQFSRDKEDRMRKRLEAQAKEREIADKLVTMSSGGAGGEYLRRQSDKKNGITISETGSQRSAKMNRNIILSSGNAANGNGKRTAESVRLSPVKKTRFVTDKGIKVAGRESTGANEYHDDDDDLDIV